MDNRLHKVINGRVVARTCKYFNPDTGEFTEGCGGVLSISDYNLVICERCEEQQRQNIETAVEEGIETDWIKLEVSK